MKIAKPKTTSICCHNARVSQNVRSFEKTEGRRRSVSSYKLGLADYGVEGKKEGEDGAVMVFVLAAADGEGSAVALDDLVADPEAEAGAANLFGGEEGFKDLFSGFGRHAGAGVGDSDDEAFATGLPVCAFAAVDEETASGGLHGVDGVDDQIAQDLPDLTFEAHHGASCAFASLNGYARVGQASLVDREGAFDQFFAGDNVRFAGLLVEAEGLVGDDGDTSQFAVGDVEILSRLGVDD